MKKTWVTVILSLIFILALFFRFYKLGLIPAGLHADAASQGYNAYSLLMTGKDRYGQYFPILFRSFGSYQPPLYTYLSIIPVTIFGNTIFSIHFISALSGLLLIFATYFFALLLFEENRGRLLFALLSTLAVAISPWAVFFSRLAVEANLGLFIFALSMFFFVFSLKKIYSFPIATLLLGISTHAYYSERLISIIFIPLFLLLFGKIYIKSKRWVAIGLFIFLTTQIPHLFALQTGAFARRFDQVTYIENQLNNDPEKNTSLNRSVEIGRTFLNNYLIYYSPKNLFFDSDLYLGRTMPGLSVFYNWTLIPFFIGISFLVKNKRSTITKLLGLLILITPIPAGLTGDFFYPLRVLNFLWVVTLIIALGLYQIFSFLKFRLVRIPIFGILLIYSIFSLYISYFILFKYEKSENYGYPYMKLMDKLSEYKNKQIVIDSARDPGIGVRIAYLTRYNPEKIQHQLKSQLQTPYYSSLVNTDEKYSIDNIEVKPLHFGDACKHDIILIGDKLAVSPKHVEEHSLKLEFEIENLAGKVFLRGYSTIPKKACLNKNLTSS